MDLAVRLFCQIQTAVLQACTCIQSQVLEYSSAFNPQSEHLLSKQVEHYSCTPTQVLSSVLEKHMI